MTSVEMLGEVVDVVIGVDTHTDTHSAAALAAGTGAVLAEITVSACAEGYTELLEFAEQLSEEHGALRAWAIEGTGSHGAGLARVLLAGNEYVVELDRPERAKRRHGAKSDSLDAVRAARESLARTRLGTPRGDGQRQVLATLLAARRSAVKAAGDAQRQLASLVITAPEPLRAKFRGHKPATMVTIAATMRTRSTSTEVEQATTRTLRTLAKRIASLSQEAAAFEKQIVSLVRAWRPDLLTHYGVGPIVAATVLCAWSHPGRIHSEAAFAKLAGVAPIPANSGRTTGRYRLSRYGDRQLNCALHTIALTRSRSHQPTREYIERRTQEGKTPREIRRCLKRYIARDLYRTLEHPTPLDRT